MAAAGEASLEGLKEYLSRLAESNQVCKVVIVSGLMVLFYDWVISIDWEVATIWTSRLTLLKFLYIMVRFGTFALQGWLAILYMPDRMSLKFCRIGTAIESFGGTVAYIPSRVLMLLRVAALYQNSRKIIWLLIVALLLQILSQFAIVVVMYYSFGAFSGFTNQPIASVPYQGCFYEKAVPFWTYWSAVMSEVEYLMLRCSPLQSRRIPPIVYDLFLCALIIAKGMRSYCYGLETSLMATIIRDSLLYYLAIGATETTTLVIWAHSRGIDNRMAAGTAISVAFEPILCCRLFLSTHDAVRGVRNGKTDGWTTSAAETVPLQVKARKKSHLDSMGYPSISVHREEEIWNT